MSGLDVALIVLAACLTLFPLIWWAYPRSPGTVPDMPRPRPEPPPRPNREVRDGGWYPSAVTEPPPAPPSPPPPPDVALIELLEKRVDKLEKAGAGLAVEDPRNWEDDAD